MNNEKMCPFVTQESSSTCSTFTLHRSVIITESQSALVIERTMLYRYLQQCNKENLKNTSLKLPILITDQAPKHIRHLVYQLAVENSLHYHMGTEQKRLVWLLTSLKQFGYV